MTQHNETSETPYRVSEEAQIRGTVYRIQYVEHPTDADVMKRQSNSGQIDGWTNMIRVYVGPERTPEATWRVIFHELTHGIVMEYSRRSHRDPHRDVRGPRSSTHSQETDFSKWSNESAIMTQDTTEILIASAIAVFGMAPFFYAMVSSYVRDRKQFKIAVDRGVRWHIANWKRKNHPWRWKPPLAPLCGPRFSGVDEAVRAELERRGYRVATSWKTRTYSIIGERTRTGGADA